MRTKIPKDTCPFCYHSPLVDLGAKYQRWVYEKEGRGESYLVGVFECPKCGKRRAVRLK